MISEIKNTKDAFEEFPDTRICFYSRGQLVFHFDKKMIAKLIARNLYVKCENGGGIFKGIRIHWEPNFRRFRINFNTRFPEAIGSLQQNAHNRSEIKLTRQRNAIVLLDQVMNKVPDFTFSLINTECVLLKEKNVIYVALPPKEDLRPIREGNRIPRVERQRILEMPEQTNGINGSKNGIEVETLSQVTNNFASILQIFKTSGLKGNIIIDSNSGNITVEI